MAFLLTLFLVVAAPQTDEASCPATRFMLNKPPIPKTEPPKAEPEKTPEKTRVAQAASVPPKPKPTPKPGDCTSEKKKG